MKKRIVILYSGGLDSKIMAEYAARTEPDAEVVKVYYDIGAEYCWKEMNALEGDVFVHHMDWFYTNTKVKDGSSSGSIFIPGRNLALATLAACQYLPDEIWLGALLGEMHADSTDKNNTFRDLANDTFAYVLQGWKKPKIVFPLAEAGFGKFEATKWAFDNGLKDMILGSSSCLNGESGACGRCVVCARRAGIFMQLGISEKYNVDPWTHRENVPMLVAMLEAEINGDGHYDEYRRREIVPALRMIYADMTDQEIIEVLKRTDVG